MTEIDLQRISLPDTANIPLFVLRQLGEVFTELKLQKLVFQVQNEAKIPGGYPYFRHYYGPYSRELHMDTLTLVHQGLLQQEPIVGLEHRYMKYNLTEQGKRYFDEFVAPKITAKDLNRMTKILLQYAQMKPVELAETVYKQWRIKQPEMVNADMKELPGTLETVKSFWETLYFPECPAITDYIAFLEYSLESLEIARKSDVVVRSVLATACKELADKLSAMAELCSNKGECPVEVAQSLCKDSDPTVHEVFEFIEDFCDRNKILPKLLDRDFSDLMTRDEFERLRTAFKAERV
jgi:uncharacterized protein YwgA